MTELEAKAFSQFDQLVDSGDLLWQNNAPRMVEFDSFNFEFRVASSLKQKPQNEDDESDPGQAFQDKKPAFSLGLFGPNQQHKLILNKFSVVRPQFVLHTLDVEAQVDGLDAEDFGAVRDALQQIGEGYMAIFNGGKDAGASVEHKHLQLIPKAQHIDQLPIVKLPPDGEVLRIKRLPYQHALTTLPADVDGEALFDIYTALLSRFDTKPTDPHNMLLTNKWMMVIPRLKAWIDEIAANAASMVGMVWCKSEAQYEGWMKRGIRDVLREMGKPWESDGGED